MTNKPKHPKRSTYNGVEHGCATMLDVSKFADTAEGETPETEHRIFPDGKMFHPSDAENPVTFDGVFRQSMIKSLADSGLQIPVDFNHLSGGSFFASPSHDEGAAAGWVTSLEDRGADGLWGKFKWTERGLKSIRADEYKYLSPEFSHKQFDKATGERIPQPRLYAVALTNRPFLEGQDRIAATDQVTDEETQTMSDENTKLSDALRQLDEAKQLLADRDSTIEKNKIAAAVQATALSEIRAQQKRDVIDQGVREGRILPTMRDGIDAYAAKCGDDVEDLRKFVASFPVMTRKTAVGQDPTGEPTGGADAVSKLSESDIAAAKAMGIKPADMAKFGDWETLTLKREFVARDGTKREVN